MIISAIAAAATGHKKTSFNLIIDRLLYTDHGQILISAIFGIALAFLFQKTCNGDKCIIIDAPDPDEINKNIYELDGICYKYKPKSVHCSASM